MTAAAGDEPRGKGFGFHRPPIPPGDFPNATPATGAKPDTLFGHTRRSVLVGAFGVSLSKVLNRLWRDWRVNCSGHPGVVAACLFSLVLGSQREGLPDFGRRRARAARLPSVSSTPCRAGRNCRCKVANDVQ